MIDFSRRSFIFFGLLASLFLFSTSGHAEDDLDESSFFDRASGITIIAATLDDDEEENAIEDEEEDKGYIINFDNVGIIEYLRWISGITGKNFVFNEQELEFNVTIISKEPASVENIMATLLQILRIHGLSLVEQGNNIIIHRSGEGSGTSTIVDDESSARAAEDSALVTRVFRLKNLTPTHVARIVKPILSTHSLVEVSDETRHLIITDLSVNIEKAEKLLRSLDSPNVAIDVGVYHVQHANIDVLVSLAEKIVTPLSLENPFTLVAQSSTKTVFIISTPYLIEKTLTILGTLDVRGKRVKAPILPGREEAKKELDKTLERERKERAELLPEKKEEGEKKEKKEGTEKKPSLDGFIGLDPSTILEEYDEYIEYFEELPPGHIDRTVFKVYKLQYHQGDKIKDSLLKIGRTLSSTGGTHLGLLSTIQSLEWVEATNSLVFTGTPESIRKIEELIISLDIPTREVFIEMLIIETSMNNSLNFSIDTGVRSGGNNLAGSVGFQNKTLSSALGSVSLSSTLNPNVLSSSEGFSVGVIGRAITHGGTQFRSLGALVRALHTDAKTSIVLNPQIVAENNSVAEIFVGTTDRFASSSIENAEGQFLTTNYEYRQIGTRLRITPSLGNSDIVTLDIQQEINSNTESGTERQSDTSLPLGPVASTKTTRTRVHVPDKNFLILSGMISEEKIVSKRRIPCLGSIPVAGAAFGGTDNTRNKRNLMMFIRPHIITSQEELEKLTNEQKGRLEQHMKGGSKLQFEMDSLLEILELKDD